MKPKKSCSKKILGFSCIMLICFMCAGCTSEEEKQEAMRQEIQLEKKMKQRIKDNANDQQAVLEHRESDNKDAHKPKIIMGEREQKGSSQSVSIIGGEEEEKESGNGIIYMTPPKESQDVIEIKPKENNDTIDLEKKSTNNGVTITKENNDDIEIKRDYESDVIIR